MKFTVELPVSEYDALVADMNEHIASMARYKLALKKTLGSAHPNVLDMNTQIARAGRAVRALQDARNAAMNPTPTHTRRETPARNVGDEMPRVYGAPRNDPRNPRRKIT